MMSGYQSACHAIRLYLAVGITCLLSDTSAFSDEPLSIAELSELAYRPIGRINTLLCDYSLGDSQGFSTNIHFESKGDLFRMERKDSSAMTLPKIPTNFPEGSNKTGEKARLLDRLNAYNGKLSQSLDAGSNKFRVWDGTAGSQYCANLALSVVYAWIFEAGSGRRLSELRDKTLWDRRWGTATYDDNSFKDNDQVVIRLPSVVEGNVECFWRVYFSKSRDFIPVKWERLTQRDQQIASTVSVNEFTVVDMNDGRSMSFPMMITDESTGADEVSWVGTRNYVVNPDTLKINTTIEDSVFTLSPGNAEVLDTRIARAAVKSKLDEVQSKARPGWTWFLVACNIAVLGIAVLGIVGLVLILRRRRNAHG